MFGPGDCAWCGHAEEAHSTGPCDVVIARSRCPCPFHREAPCECGCPQSAHARLKNGGRGACSGPCDAPRGGACWGYRSNDAHVAYLMEAGSRGEGPYAGHVPMAAAPAPRGEGPYRVPAVLRARAIARHLRVLDLPLDEDEISLLAAALDSHVYWQLTPHQHRDNGYCMGLPESASDLADLRVCFRLMRALGEDPLGWGWCDPDAPVSLPEIEPAPVEEPTSWPHGTPKCASALCERPAMKGDEHCELHCIPF